MGGYLVVGQIFLCLMGNQKMSKRVRDRDGERNGGWDGPSENSKWIKTSVIDKEARDHSPLPPTQFPQCVVNFVFNKLNFLKKKNLNYVRFFVAHAFMELS